MAEAKLRYVVEVAGDSASGQLAAISKAFNQAGIEADVAFKKTGSAARGAGAEVTSALGKFQAFRQEQVQQGRQARFLANEIMAIVPAGGQAAVTIRGLAGLLVEGAAGGLSFGLALEAAKFGVSLFTEANRVAEEQAKKTAETFRKLREEIAGIGKSPMVIELEKAIALRNALKEVEAAWKAFGASGEFVGSGGAAETRLDKANAALREMAKGLGVEGGALEDAEQLVILMEQKIAAIESDARNKRDIAQAEQQEKNSRRQIELAKATGAKVLVDQLADIAKLDEAQRRQAASAALAGPGSVGGFASLESSTLGGGGTDEVAFAAELAANASRKATDDIKRMWQEAGASIGSSLGAAFAGVVAGTVSMAQAIRSMLGSVIASIIQMAIKQVMAASVVTAAEGAQSQAGIPVVGPILAATAMGAMLAMVQGLLGSMPSASGGFDVGNINPITQLHAREMVLPAQLADKVRSMTDGGTGPTTINVYALDSRSFYQAAKDNRLELVRVLQGATKDRVYG